MVVFLFTTVFYIYSTHYHSLIPYFSAVNRFNFFDLELHRGSYDGVCSEQSYVLVCWLNCLGFLMQQNKLHYQSSPNNRSML